jgi:NCS1 family nucleobase:cation symporter-1
MSRVRDMFKWAEVKERQDIYNWRGTTEWGNHDIYPVDSKDRTFGYFAYCAYFSQSSTSISTYTIAASYVALGLSRGEIAGGIFIGAFLPAIVGFFAARPGQDYGIGYVSLLPCRLIQLNQPTFTKSEI